MFWALFLVLVCFLLGSIPSGVIVARRLKKIDLRKVGSGNPGAMNAYRALGVKGGLTVLGLDALKGLLAVFLAYFALLPGFTLPVVKVVYGFAAIAGHNYSPWLKFKGGKGIATGFGVLLALTPKVAFLCLLLWIGLLALTHYSSVASLSASATAPVLMFVYHDPPVYIIFGVVSAVFAFYRHKENIDRLLKGREIPFNAGASPVQNRGGR